MSILNSIRKVYLELSNQSKISSEALRLICDDVADNDLQGTLTDALSNVVLSYDYSPFSEDVFFNISKGDQVLLQDQRYLLSNFSFIDAIDSVIGDAGLGDILSADTLLYNAAQYGDTYSVLAEITQGYLTNVKQDATQLMSVIQSKLTINSSDKERLISAIQCSQNNGKISQESWLSIMSNVFKSSEQQVSGSTMHPVTGSAFALTSVIQIVTNVVKTLMSAVITALTVILQGIWKIIAIALQGIINLVQSFANTDIEINVDDNTNYVKGSNCLVFKTYDTRTVSATYNGDDSAYYQSTMNGILMCHPGIDMYFWQNANNNFYVNGRMVLNVEPTRFHNYLASKITYTPTHGNDQFTANINSSVYPLVSDPTDSSYIFLTDDESIRVKYDADYADQVMMASLCAMGLPLLMNTGKVQFYDISRAGQTFNSLTIYDLGALCAYYGYINNYTTFTQSNNITLYRKMWTTILNYSASSLVADWNDITYTVTTSSPSGELYSTSEQYGYEQLTEIIQVWMGCYVIWYSAPRYETQFIFNTTYARGMERFVVDSVPGGYTFTPAQFSVAELVTAVITIATLATSAFLAGKIIKRAITNRTRIRQLTRASQISNLREQYLSDPTKDNAKQLNKAINKYNRIGGLLGWDSYDLTNNWYTPRSVTLTNTGSTLISGMIEEETPSEFIVKLIAG